DVHHLRLPPAGHLPSTLHKETQAMTDQPNNNAPSYAPSSAPSAPSTARNFEVTQHGGTLRATATSGSFIPADNYVPPAAKSLTPEFSPGLHKITVKDGQTSYEHASRVQSASSGMSDTASDNRPHFHTGMGTTVELGKVNDRTLVTINGVTTDVRSALNAKLLPADFRTGSANGNAFSNPTEGLANARKATE